MTHFFPLRTGWFLTALLSLSLLQAQHSHPNWTTIGQGAVPRSEATAVAYEGEYYMFNGFDHNIDIHNRVDKYDPATNTYTSLAPMPTFGGEGKAVTHNGVALVDDVIWIVGGRVGDHPGKVTDEVWLYDISDDSWSAGPKLPVPRGGGGVGRIGRKLHYVGGFDANAQCDVGDHLVYDLDAPAAGWQDYTATSPLPLARNHIAVAVIDGKLYVVGGQHGHDGCGGGQDLDYLHAYDPVTDNWTRLTDLPGKQSHAEPSTFAYNGKIVQVGGQTSGGKGVWEYDPAGNKWSVLNNMELPLPLIAPVARVHQGNMFVLNGGKPTVSQPTNDSRVKTFAPSTTVALSFNRAALTETLQTGEEKTHEFILSNLNAEESVAYTIDTDNLPSWLTVTDAQGTARESFAELEITLAAGNLAAGQYTHVITATAAGYTSASVEIVLNVEAGTGASESVWLEAECAEVGANWLTQTDDQAADGTYVTIKPGNNSMSSAPTAAADRVSFTSTLAAAGEYKLFARIAAPSSGDDSFWVRVNNGQWIKWWQGLKTDKATFAWREVLGSPFTLPAGAVTIDVAYREDGTLLDKLFLTTSDELPTGTGPDASNCNTPPPPPPPTPATAIRINAGGPALTHQGEAFAADKNFSGGKTYENTSATVPSLYHTERSSNAPFQYSYSIPVPDGSYTVRLHFAEIYFGANGGGDGGTGKRIFDVSLEDELVLDNYDINAEVGPQTVVVKEYTVKVTDGSVDLFFDASTQVGGTNQPKLSALEVIGNNNDDDQQDAATAFRTEAACGTGGGNWERFAAGYLSYPGNNNKAAPQPGGPVGEILTYETGDLQEGTYRLHFLMSTPDRGRNSFWVSVDGGSWIKFWKDVDGTGLFTDGFEWREVNHDGAPTPLSLAAGSHTIRIAPRETGTQLDELYLGMTASVDETVETTNCHNNTQAFSALQTTSANSSILPQIGTLSVYPNPAGERLWFSIEGASTSALTATVIDFTGRVVATRTIAAEPGAGQLDAGIDLRNLPAGTYLLRIASSELAAQPLNRTFVKLR